jgi:hypothetical protein
MKLLTVFLDIATTTPPGKKREVSLPVTGYPAMSGGAGEEN